MRLRSEATALVAVGHEAQVGTHLVDQAGLHPGLREDGLDRLGEAGQPVDAADHDVGDAACLEVGQDLQPELGALATLKPDPQDLALAVCVDADRQVAGVVADRLAVADLDDERVRPGGLRSRGPSARARRAR